MQKQAKTLAADARSNGTRSSIWRRTIAGLGRATIEAALPLLQKCELADRQDACRETGRMMVTGAIVYDWCYELLTAGGEAGVHQGTGAPGQDAGVRLSAHAARARSPATPPKR